MYRTLRVVGTLFGLALGSSLIALAAVPLPSVAPSLRLDLSLSSRVGSSLRVPFPSQGESAATIPSLHFESATPAQTPQPIASLTKLMVAYVTLARLPLGLGQDGPSIEVRATDFALYRHDVRTGQSNVKVATGEVLTERQLLEGLLVPSANNFAELLAGLVAGSTFQMTADMNTAAAQLGMHSTSYADVSGFDPATQSNAIDQLHLAQVLMRNPTFASIVSLPQVWLPVAGNVVTYTPEVGRPHVVGVKAGFTSAAGGCDAIAYDARVGRHTVRVLAVVLGQRSLIVGRTDLAAAGDDAYRLATWLTAHLHLWRVALADEVVGTIGWAGNTVPVMASSTIAVPVLASVPARSLVREESWPRRGVLAGRPLVQVTITSGSFEATTTFIAGATLARASLWQRLR